LCGTTQACPKYADLNKAVTDLFADDFGFGAQKIVLKSKSASGTNFKVEGSKNAKGDVRAFIETKFNAGSIAVKEKWSTDNTVTTEFSVDNKFLDGAKVTAEAVFNPVTCLDGLKLKLKSDVIRDNLSTNVTVTSDAVITAAAVFKFGGKFLLGLTTDYSSNKGNLANSNVAFSAVEKDLIINAAVSSSSNVEASVFQKVNDNLTAGFKFSWSQTATDLHIAAKYKLDNSSFVKAKLNKSLNFGLGFTQTLSKSIQLTLAANINGGDNKSGAHSLGWSLELAQ